MLVIGENPENQPEASRQLISSKDEMTFDRRAESVPKIMSAELEHEFSKWKKDNPDELEDFETAVEWVKEWHEFRYSEEQKASGHWKNPNAKGDRCQIGGQWTGFFKLKPGREGLAGDPGLHVWPLRDGLL